MTVPSPKPVGNRISTRVRDIPPSGIRKFFDLIASSENVISLGVGEPDFVTPWNIREAAIYSIEKGYTHYTSNYGMPALRQEIARYLEMLYGVRYDPAKEILVTVGVSEALDLAARSLLNPGDQVISPEPTYVSYFPCVHMAGGEFLPVPTTMADDFLVRPEAIEAKVTERTKFILLCSPNNPTGAVLPRSTLEGIADVARRHDLLVISDEIYSRLVYDAEHVCFASLPGMQERTILLGGFSKAHAMTGWRIGFAAGPADVIEAMMKVHQYTIMSAPTAGQMAAIEALRRGEPQVEEGRLAYDQRRRLIVTGLREIGLVCPEPHGAFYAFPSIKNTGMTSEQFAEALLKEAGVAVVPGSAFGPAGEGHVRCCYAVSPEEIEEALKRMGRFMDKHGNTGR